MSYTNSSVNNNLTYITGCLAHLFQKQSKTLFEPTYLVYPDYPNYMPLTWMATPRRKTKEDQPRQRRISINSSLQRSSWIARGIEIQSSGIRMKSLLIIPLPQPLLAITVPDLMNI